MVELGAIGVLLETSGVDCVGVGTEETALLQLSQEIVDVVVVSVVSVILDLVTVVNIGGEGRLDVTWAKILPLVVLFVEMVMKLDGQATLWVTVLVVYVLNGGKLDGLREGGVEVEADVASHL